MTADARSPDMQRQQRVCSVQRAAWETSAEAWLPLRSVPHVLQVDRTTIDSID